jgi:mRNA interferase HicA
MTGSEFLKRIKAYGKANGLDVVFDTDQGKGSHGTVIVHGRKTTLKDRKKEIGPGLLRKMLKDLGIDHTKF